MAARIFRPNRRELMSGLTATLVAGPMRPSIAAESRPPLALTAQAASLALRPGQPDSPIWALQASTGDTRFKRGDRLDFRFENGTVVPVALNWRGIDGVPQAEPLLGQPALAPQGHQS